jgi:hypothetical protein
MDPRGHTDAAVKRGYCSATVIVVVSLLAFDILDDLGESPFVAQDVKRRESANGTSACGGVEHAPT